MNGITCKYTDNNFNFETKYFLFWQKICKYVCQLLIYIGIRRVNYDTNGTLCKRRIFLVAKLFLASLCLVRDPNHQSNDRCWRVRKSLIFAKRKYRFISNIRHNVLNSFWKEQSFFYLQIFPQYQKIHIL
jgi:hypothetical protein